MLNSSVFNYKSLQIIHRHFVLVVEEREDGWGGENDALTRFL